MGFVIDDFHVLTDSQKRVLNNLYAELEAKTSDEIALITIANIDSGENLVTMTAKMGNKLGVGKKEKYNGCVITYCTCQQVAICPAKGLEKTLDDVSCSKIVDTIMLPEFRQGNVFQGLWKASTTLVSILETTPKTATLK